MTKHDSISILRFVGEFHARIKKEKVNAHKKITGGHTGREAGDILFRVTLVGY